MDDPEEAKHQKAGDEAEKLWPEPEHHLREVDGRLVGRDGRQLELQGEQGNGDGKDAVTEGLDAARADLPFYPFVVLAPHPTFLHYAWQRQECSLLLPTPEHAPAILEHV